MRNNRAFFVTSTGTELGKTYLSERIIKEFVNRGVAIDCYKPILSGFNNKQINKSDSARLLLAAKKKASIENIDIITPWLFKTPVAPTIAAKKENAKISYQSVKTWCLKKQNSSTSNFILFEGAGGIMVPIEKQKSFLDLFKEINIPIILLAGSYLGTISHTLTALECLYKNNVDVINIVFNEGYKKNRVSFSENFDLLKRSIKNKITIRKLFTNIDSNQRQVKLIVNDIIRYFSNMA